MLEPNTYTNGSTKPLLIFDGGCIDGMGAALSFYLKHRNKFEYYPGIRTEPPPNVTGRHVYMADFAYKRPLVEEMAKTAQSVTIIDHHRSTMLEYSDGSTDVFGATEGNLTVLFNMNQSGAMMAWLYWHNEEDCPRLFHHIQDIDLWRFEFDQTREITMGLRSHPYRFDVWKRFLTKRGLEKLRKEGEAIGRFNTLKVDDLYENRFMATINGYRVPVCNAPNFFASDLGNKMCEGYPFAATFAQLADGRWQYSFRSNSDGVDVSEIAKVNGGGGHIRASGCTVNKPIHVKL
jgi:oligoribonuclease NrnB/cAMP/cGMP phosphodiesterase (DHH superfamily)